MKQADKKPLLVVGGPTASGKTRLAVDLAKALNGEIVCADSMQVYRGMEIGTAAPTPEEQQGIPHHLFGILSPEESFSVARYVELATQVIEEIHSRGKLPILCGGTGLYISALTDNIRFDEAIPENPALRQDLRKLAAEKGNEHLWSMLQEVDPPLAQKLHPNNLGRIIRALEVYRASGCPMSEWQRRAKQGECPYRLCFLALCYRDRQTLYRRINMRVDQMLQQGLLEEVKALLDKGYQSTAMQAIGYKEMAGYLAGEQSLEEAVETLQRQTRRYAKRQLTWLRRDERIHWLEADAFDSYESLLQAALDTVKESGITLPKEENHEK